VAEQITFAGVTPEKLAEARGRLMEQGIPVGGNIGMVTKDGYTVSYLYDEPSECLTLTLHKKPWIVPASLIRRKLKAALAAEGIFERT
jgi:hypothetical protein